jgi:hypothetical protein
VARLVERWQTGIILTMPEGAVRTFDWSSMLYANGRPNVVGPWETPIGEVSYPRLVTLDTTWVNRRHMRRIPIPSALGQSGSCHRCGHGMALLWVPLRTARWLDLENRSSGTPGAVLQSATAATPVWVLPLLENPLPGHQGNLGKNHHAYGFPNAVRCEHQQDLPDFGIEILAFGWMRPIS